MNKRTLRPFVEEMTFTECPRWHDDRLWFCDFYTLAVYAVGMDGVVEKIVDVPNRPGGLGWLPDGRLLVVSSLDRKVLRLEPDGALVEHADLGAVMLGPANDMIVTASGVAYVGNMGFDVLNGASFAPARLVGVVPDGTYAPVSEPLYFPNGSVVTADGKTLIVAETMANRLSKFPVLAGHALGPREDWACFGDLPKSDQLIDIIAQSSVGADGIAIDRDDNVWLADAYHHRVLHVAEGGEILEEISLGDQQAYAVALGGADLKSLFICVAPNFYEHERSKTREGRILTCRIDS